MALTNYWKNKLIDANLRAQSISFPATRYIALFTVAPTASSSGTEVVASGYARVAVTSSLTNWSGTQGAGTTSTSSGTSGEVSNNAAVTLSSSIPAAWSGIVAWGMFDASSSGNLLEFGSIVDGSGSPVTRSFSIGDAVEFAAGSLVASWT